MSTIMIPHCAQCIISYSNHLVPIIMNCLGHSKKDSVIACLFDPLTMIVTDRGVPTYVPTKHISAADTPDMIQ